MNDDDDVQKDVVTVDEKIKRDSFLSAKQQIRRTVSDDNRLQDQQQPQLPSLATHHVSQAKADFTLLSPVSACLSHDAVSGGRALYAIWPLNWRTTFRVVVKVSALSY